jgi:hypothetical protein
MINFTIPDTDSSGHIGGGILLAGISVLIISVVKKKQSENQIK